MESTSQTRGRLADAAEVLFAEKGIEGASLREITKAAGVNLAAVSYHFGSKEGLLREVLGRRLNPVNSRRLELLDELEVGGECSVEGVLEAFITPVLDPKMAPSGHFIQLMSRMHTAPSAVIDEMLGEVFGPVMQRYLMVFGKLLPELAPHILYHRMQFVIGAMVHSLFMQCGARCHKAMTPVQDLAPEVFLQQFVAFCAAGMRNE